MRGTVYYFYDRILVTNCKLRTLEPYAGRVPKGSAVQLLVYPLGAENIPLSASAGISVDGDFYLAALSKNIIYQVHKSGTLIRVYAESIAQVEETVKSVPMSILAMIQKNILLKGSIISTGQGAYVLVDGAERSSFCGEACQDTVLLVEEEEGYKGISSLYPGKKSEMSQEIPGYTKLKGVVKVQYAKRKAGNMPVNVAEDELVAGIELIQTLSANDGIENSMVLIEDEQEKKNLLLENMTGYSMLSQSFQKQIGASPFIEKAVKNLTMAVIVVP